MMLRPGTSWRLSTLALGLVACDGASRTPAPPPPPSAAPSRAGTSGASASTPSSEGSSAAPAVTASAAAEPPVMAPPAVAPIDPDLPPTPEQWATGGKVDVAGVDERGCEARMLKPWLQVACNGVHAPRSIEVTRGGGDGKTLTYQSPEGVSLVLPFVEGVDVAAQLRWKDETMKLRVRWPRGTAEPPEKGTLEPL